MISADIRWKSLLIHATFELSKDSKVMAYMNNVNYRSVSNTRMSSRVRQLLVLISTILVGMLVSVFAGA
jgi:hypothetical protein